MVSVDLLMFDLDGTLIDSCKDIADSVNRTFRALNLPEKPREEIYAYVGNGVRRLISASVGDVEPNLIDRALEIFEEIYLEHLLDETRFYPGVDEILDHFVEKKKAVVTNKPILYTNRILEGLCGDGKFDLVVGGDNVTPLKPQPDMIFHTLRHLEIRNSRAVLIGDSVNDILAARAAGVLSCAVGYGFGSFEELKESEPTFFIEHIQDLKQLFT